MKTLIDRTFRDILRSAMTLLWVVITVLFVSGRDCTAQVTKALSMKPNSKTMALKEQEVYGHITTNDTVRTIVNHPAFKGFSQLILPRDNNTDHYDTPLSNVRSLMPYHGHVDPDIPPIVYYGKRK